MNQVYKIILFYKYVHIDDPKQLRDEQFALCQRLGLKGRGIVAEEGINCTFEGTKEACDEYMQIMNNDPLFTNIHWKVSDGTPDGTAFPRLSVKVRPEIVSLHLANEDFDPNELTGKHIKPEELNSWYKQNEEFYIVDMRNDYELKVGKFNNTIFPGMKNFRDLRNDLENIQNLKNKKVLTVCTGGVRCEKASGLLLKKGFKDVYQLDGGIVSYMEKFPGQDFKGSLYVFDKRNTMHFDNPENHEIIGKCDKCGVPSEHYVNCANLFCHNHFICCENCLADSPADHPSGGVAYCNWRCYLKWKLYSLKKNLFKKFAR